MPSIQLQTLGSFSVRAFGEPLPSLRHYRSDLLLLYLVLEQPHAHPREHLMALFWPTAREEAGRANLRQALHRVRRFLEHVQLSHLLQSDAHAVRLLPDPAFELDVLQLQALHDTCERHTHRRRSACHACVNRLMSLTPRYEGPFLASVVGLTEPLENWRTHWQSQLQKRVLKAHGELITYFEGMAAADRGQLPHALHHARQLLQLEPFHEETHRRLMQLLALSGQRSAACRHYEAFAQRLEAELDAEPEDETEELYQQLLHGELPEPDSSLATLSGRTPLPSTWRSHDAAERAFYPPIPAPMNLFLGRQAELTQLMEWL